ncbi:MAG TPA: FecR domain-containing protein [Thermoanaerobaculia bacterium]
MNGSRKELDALIERGTEEVRRDVPTDTACEEAAARVWARLSDRLSASPGETAAADTAIEGCDDVRLLLPAYVAGELPEAKALLLQDHTRECLPCRRALMAAREGRPAPAPAPAAWSAEEETTAREAAPGRQRFLLAAAAVLVAVLGVAALVATGVIGGAGPAFARVEALDGGLYLIDEDGSRPLSAGDEIRRGQAVRTAKGSGAVLELEDGSRVEMRERTELAGFAGRRDTTVDLARGSVILEASKRSRGHLFVDTEDCRVAVTGTIFAVNHGTKGSRVSVVEGEVRVEQGRREELLHPGEQVTTRAYLSAVPVAEEIAWSQDVDRYLALLAELNALHEEIRQAVDSPAPRTSTRLLDLAPADTFLYAAVPNVTESLDQARQVFSERLEQSPVLRELLAQSGSLEHQAELDRLVARVRDYGSFLGDEVALAIAGHPGDAEPSPVAYAMVLEPEAFRTFVEQEMAVFGGEAPLHLVSGPEEAAALGGAEGIYLWLTDGYAVASVEADGIAAMAASLAGTGGFAGSAFHQTLTAAYLDGVEWLLAADLASLVARSPEPVDLFGFEDVRHLVARWSESGESASARAELSFDGPRRGVASWLGAPAPMGSLEYVTGDAAAAGAFVVRDPAQMVDELMAMLLDRDPEALAELERLQQEEGFDLRADLAAPLGGELAVALDGPLAPSPSFKVVVEVYDPVRLQQTLEWAVARLDQELRDGGGETGVSLTSEEAGGRTFYRVSTPAAEVAVYYTYDDAYLVAAPSRALLEGALTARATGANLPATERFRSLLPTDGYANFSAVVYQDLGSRLAPLAGTLAQMQEGGRELTAEERRTVERAAELHPPTLGYAYGEEDRILFAATFGGQGSFLARALLGAAGGFDGLAGLEGLMGDAE